MNRHSPIFVWVSRHELTQAQRQSLEALGIPASRIIEAGDCDAFDREALAAHIALRRPAERTALTPVIVGVVHPAAALNAHFLGYRVAVARNVNRAPEGEPPRFEFAGWHIY